MIDIIRIQSMNEHVSDIIFFFVFFIYFFYYIILNVHIAPTFLKGDFYETKTRLH
nr:MAG TPA: hypothetical protein [Caudoviricetes sp.]